MACSTGEPRASCEGAVAHHLPVTSAHQSRFLACRHRASSSTLTAGTADALHHSEDSKRLQIVDVDEVRTMRPGINLNDFGCLGSYFDDSNSYSGPGGMIKLNIQDSLFLPSGGSSKNE